MTKFDQPGSLFEALRNASTDYIMEEESAKWQKYNGPHGGHGWRNGATGEIVYQEEMPGGGGDQKQDAQSQPASDEAEQGLRPEKKPGPTGEAFKSRSDGKLERWFDEKHGHYWASGPGGEYFKEGKDGLPVDHEGKRLEGSRVESGKQPQKAGPTGHGFRSRSDGHLERWYDKVHGHMWASGPGGTYFKEDSEGFPVDHDGKKLEGKHVPSKRSKS